jgi:Zn-dependent protease/CBS domain-containing protein
MSGSFRLGKILGIDIRIHYSWFLIFAFVSYYVYGDFHSDNYDFAISLLMGLVASMALLVCIVAHELAHSLVAMRNGIPVRSITLFILGGVANITKEAERPKTEMLMAIAGPLCSLALGLAFGAAWFATGGHHEDATAFHGLLFWLATLNLSLGVFNLLPGFPMDGGRVLRAVTWQITGNYKKATRIASVAGQIVGWLIAGAGVSIVIAYLSIGSGPFDLFDGIYFVLLGWFLSSIAASSYRQVAWSEALQGITATSAMVSDFMTISPDISLMQLIRDYIQPNRYRSFVVATQGRFLGVVDVESIRRVSQDRWDMTPAGLVMTPAANAITVAPEEEGISIAEKMEEHRLEGIPVVRDGVVIGIVTRNSLARVMQMRSQSGT